MYLPKHFTADEESTRELLSSMRAADLITATPSGLFATFLPLLYDAQAGPHGALLGHVARKNDHWRLEPIGEAMVIVHGPDAYISPGWYPSKREHGRVVPTWNYVTAHVYGTLQIHDDPVWVEQIVRRLTDRYEAGTGQVPWSVDDAPREYIDGQLRAIVGVELMITRVQAKAKLGQNRPPPDIDSVVDQLESSGADLLARATEHARHDRD